MSRRRVDWTKYNELLKAVAPNVHHRIDGERHDKEAMRRWLERVGRGLPNLHIKVNNSRGALRWAFTAAIAQTKPRTVQRLSSIRIEKATDRISCLSYATITLEGPSRCIWPAP